MVSSSSTSPVQVLILLLAIRTCSSTSAGSTSVTAIHPRSLTRPGTAFVVAPSSALQRRLPLSRRGRVSVEGRVGDRVTSLAATPVVDVEAMESISAVTAGSSLASLQRVFTADVSDSTDDAPNATTDPLQLQLETFSRVIFPSLGVAVLSALLFPSLSMAIASLIADAGVFAVLGVDSSQFVQNFLTVTGLTFSILVGQTYYFMYQQQEAVFMSLFREVTEAKSLLEQCALVCQGRKAMYRTCLESIARYVEEDLKQLDKDPAVLLSARPMDDPLEIIMYMTSVGEPSNVYQTVRSLRQARAVRLGALQRKLPGVHIALLWVLAIIELSSFPLLGAGTQTLGGYNILTVEGCLFGIMTFGIVLTLSVVGELWQTAGGAYNVDGVLEVMVKGLDEELQIRMVDAGSASSSGRNALPAATYGYNVDIDIDRSA